MRTTRRRTMRAVSAAIVATVTLTASLALGAAPAGANGVEWPAEGTVMTGLGSTSSASGHPARSARVVALTFDDGPHPTRTPAILDTLARNGITATFFVLEQNAVRYPDLIRRMVREGHVVAPHSIDHTQFTRLSESQQRHQIVHSADAIDKIAGAGTSRCIRPPYGSYNSTTVRIARERGLAVALWSRDTNDWRGHSTTSIVAAATSSRTDGGRGVVLMHDTVAGTPGAVQQVIDSLRSNGYNFTTICGTPKPSGPPPLPVAVGLDPPDFDGDGVDDLFWYGPGAAPDSLWLWDAANDRYRSEPVQVGSRYTPITGDFDGNGADDIFWYAPGAVADSLWQWTGDRFQSTTYSVSGTYTPLVGDFDGDGADDIFWYAPGAGVESLWRWKHGRLQGTEYSVGGTYTPIIGDVDGNGADDVFWYAPGSAPDSLWRGTSTGFTSTVVAVHGTYQPVVRHAAGQDEILWTTPTATATSVGRWRWVDGAIVGTDLRVESGGQSVVGDYDGDGNDDIVWYAAGPGRDVLWRSEADGGFRSEPISISGTYQPLPGHHSTRLATPTETGDAAHPLDDIIWYGPGTAPDAMWLWDNDRFGSGSIAVNGTFQVLGYP